MAYAFNPFTGNLDIVPPVTIAASGSTGAGQAIGNTDTVVNFDSTAFDTAGAISNPATNWTFTAPEARFYNLSLFLTAASETWIPTDYFLMKVVINGSATIILFQYVIETTFTNNIFLNGATLLSLAAGDTVQILAITNHSGGTSLYNNSGYNYVNINAI